MSSNLLNQKQAAAFLGLSYSAFQGRIKSNNAPKPIDGRYPRRYSLPSLQEYQESYRPKYGGGAPPKAEVYTAFTVRLPARMTEKISQMAKTASRSRTSQIEQLLGAIL